MDITSQDTIQALEWDRICRIAASLAASPLGAERFEELLPFSTIELALKTMDRTTEMVRLQTESSGGVPMDGLYDIRDELKRVSVEGASLEPEILYRIAATMDCSVYKQAGKDVFSAAEHTDNLVALYSDIEHG